MDMSSSSGREMVATFGTFIRVGLTGAVSAILSDLRNRQNGREILHYKPVSWTLRPFQRVAVVQMDSWEVGYMWWKWSTSLHKLVQCSTSAWKANERLMTSRWQRRSEDTSRCHSCLFWPHGHRFWSSTCLAARGNITWLIVCSNVSHRMKMSLTWKLRSHRQISARKRSPGAALSCFVLSRSLACHIMHLSTKLIQTSLNLYFSHT